MKNTIFLLFSIFSLSAFTTQSAIMVTSYDLPFILFSNDRQINSQPQKQVTVRNISGETCRLYLTFEDRSIPPVKKMVFTNPIDKDIFVFVLSERGDVELNTNFDTEVGVVTLRPAIIRAIQAQIEIQVQVIIVLPSLRL